MGDAGGQHPRLADPRARQHQHRAVERLDGGALLGVEPLEIGPRGRAPEPLPAGIERRKGVERQVGRGIEPRGESCARNLRRAIAFVEPGANAALPRLVGGRMGKRLCTTDFRALGAEKRNLATAKLVDLRRTPPPPCFAWSPSPALARRGGQGRRRRSAPMKRSGMGEGDARERGGGGAPRNRRRLRGNIHA